MLVSLILKIILHLVSAFKSVFSVAYPIKLYHTFLTAVSLGCKNQLRM